MQHLMEGNVVYSRAHNFEYNAGGAWEDGGATQHQPSHGFFYLIMLLISSGDHRICKETSAVSTALSKQLAHTNRHTATTTSSLKSALY